ncbi:MAG: hypothetical protein AAB380_05585 [Verrucomicrobiota bacterium]
MKQFLPPPVTPLVEEPIAMGGVYALRTPEETGNAEPNRTENRKQFLPPLMTPLVEEPIAMGGW